MQKNFVFTSLIFLLFSNTYHLKAAEIDLLQNPATFSNQEFTLTEKEWPQDVKITLQGSYTSTVSGHLEIVYFQNGQKVAALTEKNQKKRRAVARHKNEHALNATFVLKNVDKNSPITIRFIKGTYTFNHLKAITPDPTWPSFNSSQTQHLWSHKKLELNGKLYTTGALANKGNPFFNSAQIFLNKPVAELVFKEMKNGIGIYALKNHPEAILWVKAQAAPQNNLSQSQATFDLRGTLRRAPQGLLQTTSSRESTPSALSKPSFRAQHPVRFTPPPSTPSPTPLVLDRSKLVPAVNVDAFQDAGSTGFTPSSSPQSPSSLLTSIEEEPASLPLTPESETFEESPSELGYALRAEIAARRSRIPAQQNIDLEKTGQRKSRTNYFESALQSKFATLLSPDSRVSAADDEDIPMSHASTPGKDTYVNGKNYTLVFDPIFDENRNLIASRFVGYNAYIVLPGIIQTEKGTTYLLQEPCPHVTTNAELNYIGAEKIPLTKKTLTDGTTITGFSIINAHASDSIFELATRNPIKHNHNYYTMQKIEVDILGESYRLEDLAYKKIDGTDYIDLDQTQAKKIQRTKTAQTLQPQNQGKSLMNSPLLDRLEELPQGSAASSAGAWRDDE